MQVMAIYHLCANITTFDERKTYIQTRHNSAAASAKANSEIGNVIALIRIYIDSYVQF